MCSKTTHNCICVLVQGAGERVGGRESEGDRWVPWSRSRTFWSGLPDHPTSYTQLMSGRKGKGRTRGEGIHDDSDIIVTTGPPDVPTGGNRIVGTVSLFPEDSRLVGDVGRFGGD